MRDILDPANIWLGTPGGSVVFGNKRPIAVDDTLNVQKNSGPVTVPVLANDSDPEGAPLTLVSASAALGTAVAETDNTVTYTPPVGLTGSDTVVYEIADDLNQRHTAQINVTIVEPTLSITTAPDNTLVVNAATGVIDITVTTPAEFAGTYQASMTDLTGGPVNLVPPSITGQVIDGQVLTGHGGLWIYDTGAGLPVQSWQWQRGGADILGATSGTYTVTAADSGQAITLVETQTDGFGQRSATSAAIGGASFTPADDAQLIGWWDADDAASLTENNGLVSLWSGKGGTAINLAQASASDQPGTGARTLNGLNVLNFTGSAYLGASAALPASGDIAFHMALIIDGATNAYEAVLAVDAADNDFQLDANNATQFDGRLNLAGLGSSVTLSGGPFSGPVILSVVLDRTGSAQARVFVSNTERGNTAYTTTIASAVSLYVMANRSLNAKAQGAVAELIVTGDISNRAAHHAYLSGKWGLT